jgi:undecaprenyl-diphosphatase
MTPLQAVLLALVQAATEFLPISSSGHLILIPRLLGWRDQGLEFDIATNTGTLIAVVAYFRADLLRISRGCIEAIRVRDASSEEARLGAALVIGTVPAAIAGLLLKHWIETAARGWQVVAIDAAVYGAILYLADHFGRRERSIESIGPREGLWIGVAQALALVPGTSRSGVTMSAARILRFDRESAARFSFLLAVPVGALVGAKQLLDFARGVPLGVSGRSIAIGIGVAAVAGYFVIAWLLGWVRRRSLTIFAVYRLALAAALWLYFSGS